MMEPMDPSVPTSPTGHVPSGWDDPPVPGWPAVVARGLHKRYGSKVAVQHLDLDIPVGSFCGLVGPNGSGKTTTLGMISAMVDPDGGASWVSGYHSQTNHVEVRRLLGVVADPLSLFDRLSAREWLRHVGELRGLDKQVTESRIGELLAIMDLTESADLQMGGYSHGMRKKTAIAAALLHRPQVLLLDEPFEGVDPISAIAVRSLLDRFRASGGTIVFSSHVMDLVDRMCDYVVVMAHGQVVAAGPVEELRGTGRLEDAFVSLVGASPVDIDALSWLAGN